MAHSSTSALVSAVDTRNGLVGLDDVSGSSGPSNGASVMIRVQDKQARGETAVVVLAVVKSCTDV